MTTTDAQLVIQVVQQVLAALRQQQPTAAEPSVTPAVKPFTSAAPKKVFVTADVLAQRLRAAEHGGAIELAANEHLTPSAADLAQQRHVTIRRAGCGSGNGRRLAGCAQETPVAVDPGAIGVLVVNGDDTVDGVLRALGHDGLTLAEFGGGKCWIRDLQVLATAVASGVVSAGMAILPQAAEAMVLANKVRGVRAVQGVSVEAVASAVDGFGANILVVDHAATTFHQLRTMIRRFATRRSGQSASSTVMAAVAGLEGA